MMVKSVLSWLRSSLLQVASAVSATTCGGQYVLRQPSNGIHNIAPGLHGGDHLARGVKDVGSLVDECSCARSYGLLNWGASRASGGSEAGW